MNDYNNFTHEIFINRKWLKYSGWMLFINSLVGLYGISLEQIWIAEACLLISGIIYLIHGYKFWLNKFIGFCLHIGGGFLYLYIALFNQLKLIELWPFLLLIAVSYMMTGFFRLGITVLNSHYIMHWILTGVTGCYNIFIATYLFIAMETVNYELLLIFLLGDSLLTGLALTSLAFKHTRHR